MREAAAAPATLATAKYLLPLDPTNSLAVAQRAPLERRAVTPGNDSIDVLDAQVCRMRAGYTTVRPRTEDLEHTRRDFQGLTVELVPLVTDDLRRFPICLKKNCSWPREAVAVGRF